MTMMRKLPPFFTLALLLAACLSEKNVDPANASTFTRYFSDGFANEPIAVEETQDKGFIILANSNFKNTEADFNKERIEIIKTDQYGHTLWQRYYPDNDFANTAEKRWSASSLIVLGSGGYLVVGQQIEGRSTASNTESIARHLLLFTVNDLDGEMLSDKVYTGLMPNNSNFPSLNGRAVVEAPSTTSATDSSFYVLALSPDPAVQDNIFVAEIRSNNLNNVVWTQQYIPDVNSAVKVELTNKIFYRPASGLAPNSLFFAGTRIFSETNTNAFVSRIGLNEAGTLTGLKDIDDVTKPEGNEYGLDFCQRGNQFGLVGYQTTTNRLLGDIMYCPISSQGEGNTITTYNTEIFDKPDDAENSKEEKGNAISSSNDGGFIVAGTIDTYTGVLGRGNTDMILIKINGFGEKVWSTTFGTPDADASVSVRPTSDGGFVLLGRSRIAALNTVVLIKTNNEGDVE